MERLILLRNMKVKLLFGAVSRIMGYMMPRTRGQPNHPVQNFPKRVGEVTRNFARSDKAYKVLGFAPKIHLLKGLEETWEWYLEHREEVLSLQESDS